MSDMPVHDPIRVVIESRFKGSSVNETGHFKHYARRALLDSLSRNEAPYMSHLLYPQVLDDNDDEQRALGIRAGLMWTKVVDWVIVYYDLGVSSGMWLGIEAAFKENKPVIFRSLKEFAKSTPPYEEIAKTLLETRKMLNSSSTYVYIQHDMVLIPNMSPALAMYGADYTANLVKCLKDGQKSAENAGGEP